jgi:RNA polymerase sigma-70 factor, ECF subfamily
VAVELGSLATSLRRVLGMMTGMVDNEQNREFVRLWTAHGQRVYAYILTLLPNRADADELFQETGATLWEKFDQFQSGSNFRSWACRIALNKVRNFRQLRQHRVTLLSNESLNLVAHVSTAQSHALDRQHQFLADCYAKLTPADQQLIDLRYEPSATVKTVSHRVGRSVDAIYKALARIHRALFDCVRNAADKEGKE